MYSSPLDGDVCFFPDIDFAVAPVPQLYELVATLRESGQRVAPIVYGQRRSWLILGFSDVSSAFLHEKSFPSADFHERISVPIFGRVLNAMRGAEHLSYRRAIEPLFSAAAVETFRELVLVPLAHELFDELRGTDSCDLRAHYAQRYTFRVISTLIGVPVQDERTVMSLLSSINGVFFGRTEEAAQASAKLTKYLMPLIEERRRHPCEDLLSALTVLTVDGHPLSNEEILIFVRFLYPVGADSTSAQIVNLLYHVAADAELRNLLIQRPAIRPKAIAESLRHSGAIAFVPRYSAGGGTLAGVEIPPNSPLLYGIGPAAHDPAVNPDPEEFRLHRENPRHLAFGLGLHVCLGRHLATAELQTSLDVILDRMADLRLATPAQRMTGTLLRTLPSLSVEYELLSVN